MIYLKSFQIFTLEVKGDVEGTGIVIAFTVISIYLSIITAIILLLQEMLLEAMRWHQ